MGNDDVKSMNLMLLVNKKSGRIIYGEAGKELADLIFSFLVLPIGCVLKLLSASKGHKIVGSVSNLYESMDKLPSVLMNRDKLELLNPIVTSGYSPTILKIDSGKRIEQGDNFYICPNSMNNVTCFFTPSYTSAHGMSRRAGETCPCGTAMDRVVQFRQNASDGMAKTNESEGSSGGASYVKETVTFIITDDLKVMPSSTIASITLLNRLNINDISQLEERVTDVGPNEFKAGSGSSVCFSDFIDALK